MKLSALVATFNEEKHLKDCLDSLKFCDEIKVVDLGSTDQSVEIASSCGVDLIHHKHVPFVEMLWPDLIPTLKYDWVLRVDPDEVFQPEITTELAGLLENIPEDVGLVTLPYQYYFLSKPLQYTPWGGRGQISKVLHRERVTLAPNVHAGFALKAGYRQIDLPPASRGYVRHYWVDTYGELFAKHRRYLAHEGQSRYDRGARFSFRKMLKACKNALGHSLLTKQGWRGGWSGWFLSFFYAGYEFMAWLSLYRYGKKLRASSEK